MNEKETRAAVGGVLLQGGQGWSRGKDGKEKKKMQQARCVEKRRRQQVSEGDPAAKRVEAGLFVSLGGRRVDCRLFSGCRVCLCGIGGLSAAFRVKKRRRRVAPKQHSLPSAQPTLPTTTTTTTTSAMGAVNSPSHDLYGLPPDRLALLHTMSHQPLLRHLINDPKSHFREKRRLGTLLTYSLSPILSTSQEGFLS